MKVISIKENSDFKRLYYRGKSEARRSVALYFRKNRFSYNRLGITVSPKLGKAVVRNAVKRRLKENYRLLQGLLEKGYDIVIVARKRAAQASFYELKNDLESALRDGGLLKGNEND